MSETQFNPANAAPRPAFDPEKAALHTLWQQAVSREATLTVEITLLRAALEQAQTSLREAQARNIALRPEAELNNGMANQEVVN